MIPGKYPALERAIFQPCEAHVELERVREILDGPWGDEWDLADMATKVMDILGIENTGE